MTILCQKNLGLRAASTSSNNYACPNFTLAVQMLDTPVSGTNGLSIRAGSNWQ